MLAISAQCDYNCPLPISLVQLLVIVFVAGALKIRFETWYMVQISRSKVDFHGKMHNHRIYLDFVKDTQSTGSIQIPCNTEIRIANRVHNRTFIARLTDLGDIYTYRWRYFCSSSISSYTRCAAIYSPFGLAQGERARRAHFHRILCEQLYVNAHCHFMVMANTGNNGHLTYKNKNMPSESDKLLPLPFPIRNNQIVCMNKIAFLKSHGMRFVCSCARAR